MSKKLSPAMIKALTQLNAGSTLYPGNFATMEALRRRGFAERYTTYSIGADYATKDGVVKQYRAPARKPMQHHEWWATHAGIADRERAARRG